MNITNQIKLFAILASTLLATACAVNPSNEASRFEHQKALSFAPESDKAVLYLLRPGRFVNSGVNSSFRVNDQRLGEFKSGYFRMTLSPGKHQIRSFFPSNVEDEFYRGEHSRGVKTLVVSAKAGEVIYVRFLGDPKRFGVVDASYAQKEIHQLDMYRSGFSHMGNNYETPEDIAWKNCNQQNTLAACNEVLTKFPKGEHRAKAKQAIDQIQADQKNAKLRSAFSRDQTLPVQVRKDKYMVALTTRLKQENFSEALVYFEQLEELGVELSPSFYFFYGEALLKTDRINEAIDKLYGYITKVGNKGKYYSKALELVNQAEAIQYRQ